MSETKRPVIEAVCSLIIFFCLLPVPPARGGTLDGRFAARLAVAEPTEKFAVIVRLKEPAGGIGDPAVQDERRSVRQERVIRRLRERGRLPRENLVRGLAARAMAGDVEQVRELWICNGLSLTAPADVIRELAERDDVAAVVPDRVITLQASAAAPAAVSNWNLDLIGAPLLWSQGFRGQEVVVGSMDTGVDISHPALGHKWRGGTNSWFDPYRHSTLPYDSDGHGTGTMGILVGGNTTDNPVGVAPAALWIAAKIFDDSRQATLSAIHAAFQWMIDPDGDPATADAPDVVNNSWDLGNAGGYDDEFILDIAALRSAGIAVVFAAGNGGIPPQPSGNTSMSPGNNPGAFPVGATDRNDQVAYFSSRGPSAFDGTSLYPLLAAPGVAIRTTGLNGTYSVFENNGTSFAAPHVAGVVALLLSGRPQQLTANPAAIEFALTASAHDLGPLGPDNSYGQGRLDAAGAVVQAGLPVPDPPSGDVNGDGRVDLVDALQILQTVTGLIPPTPQMMQQGDVGPFDVVPHPDGVINILDAVVILQKAAGIVDF